MTETDLDYTELLKRAKENLPEVASEHQRFQLPDLDIMYEGNNTIIRNFADFAKVMRREPEQFLGVLLKELGTAGHMEGQRVVLKGIVDERTLISRIESYLEMYVLCAECHRPDTHIVREGRTSVLVCEACGARRPLMVKKASATPDKVTLHEGQVYEFVVTGMGRKGEGRIDYGKYTIYVAGARKGDKVKVRIQHIKGSLAFGALVEKLN